MEKLIITPRTKIYDLLEAYPELEAVLIGMAPQFNKLKNPVLRKTITRVTNLNQAASIGGLKVQELVNTLRTRVGQSTLDTTETGKTHYNKERPGWFDENAVIKTIDIREMLNAGEQPVHEVLSSIRNLDKKEILKVIAPFIPAPLIDKSLSLEYKHWLDKKSEEEIWIFFHK